ncbi:MAG: UbiH/UbiF/VisC/COQ6 family ubiquinone biosynthesis hydroxylase [Chromatiaceae bacterium]|nr:UbiH/UbiF/VisC/COQ6 family ubiquinone biosynthesis hydroxylase [Chromatiaceae bacterium]
MSDSDHAFDLVIAGAGMVGAALACACRGRGWRIGVVEARPPQRDWPAGEVDLRVSALNRASQRLLSRLGVWERIQALGASPYREMHVWDAVGGGSIHFDCADLGEPDLGHIVENRVTQLALWEALEQSPDVDLLCPAEIAAAVVGPEAVVVALADGRRLSARLLVGADGRDSRVRGLMGIGTQGWDYDQTAIVANVEVADGHRETAWQRFLPTGPLAFLPLRDGRCSIVWSATEPRASELMTLSDEAFRTELEDAFERRLGALGAIGPRGAFPLRLQHAEHYVAERLALIGDAAHAIHPLAGQGVNLGLLDAAELFAALDFARDRGRDIGGLWTLRRYERARRGANLAMLGAMDGFKRLFSNRIPPLAALRSAGMAAADRIAPLKRVLMREALGLGYDPPPIPAAGRDAGSAN